MSSHSHSDSALPDVQLWSHGHPRSSSLRSQQFLVSRSPLVISPRLQLSHRHVTSSEFLPVTALHIIPNARRNQHGQKMTHSPGEIMASSEVERLS